MPAAAATIRAGITQYLEEFEETVHGALERGLLTEAEVEAAIRTNFRVMLRLGLLDPPDAVPFAAVSEHDPEPWESEEHRALVRHVTRKSFVLLKNSDDWLPLAVEQQIAVNLVRADDDVVA